MVKSIVYSDTEALLAILKLHTKSQVIDLDATYSSGGFYKKEVPQPRIKSDLFPKYPDVMQADTQCLPFSDRSMEVIVFDPPFLATTGPSLQKKDTSNRLNKRFGVYPNEKELFNFYEKSLEELYRICKKGGILIFKCQDKVSSGIQYFSHCWIYNKAIEKGWYPKDFFILFAKNRIVANWQKANQKHARKWHAYYWVFQKKA